MEEKVVSKPNSSVQKMATFTINTGDAEALLTKGQLKIDLFTFQKLPRTVVPKCFKRLGFGHIASKHNGSDCSRCCCKYAKNDHRADSFKVSLSCFICSSSAAKPEESDHVSGSSRCRVYRLALDKQTGSRRMISVLQLNIQQSKTADQVV